MFINIKLGIYAESIEFSNIINNFFYAGEGKEEYKCLKSMKKMAMLSI